MKMKLLSQLLFGVVLASALTDANACLTTPAPSNILTSLYGWRFHPVYHRWRLHKGDDFRASIGTTVVASHSGTVQTGYSASGGNELRIIGDDGMVTRYLHLSHASVSPGTHVSAGDEVALSGNTGEASAAAHLHFEAYPNGSSVTNPEPLFCNAPTRKSGADSVNGFPILACDPDNGQCDTSGGPPATASTGSSSSGSSGSSSGNGTATAAVTDVPPAPTISSFDDMSTNEIFVTEVTKRFSNPDWYQQESTMSTVPLIIEYAHMKALQQYIQFHKSLAHERVETLLAAKLAKKVKRDIAPRLERQRMVASKAGAGAE
jgi:hypothetical protein